jgi:hypothetical protein
MIPDCAERGHALQFVGNHPLGSVKFKVGDKQSECTPKTPAAMNAAKAAIEPCLCKDADGDGEPDPPDSPARQTTSDSVTPSRCAYAASVLCHAGRASARA